MAWTDELKAQAIAAYKAKEPTGETSVEIVKEIAEEMGESPNGVRMILTKAGVYIAKTPGKASTASGSSAASGDKAPRVSKESSQAALTQAIEGLGKEADSEIISKLTGKAAVYFTKVLEGLSAE